MQCSQIIPTLAVTYQRSPVRMDSSWIFLTLLAVCSHQITIISRHFQISCHPCRRETSGKSMGMPTNHPRMVTCRFQPKMEARSQLITKITIRLKMQVTIVRSINMPGLKVLLLRKIGGKIRRLQVSNNATSFFIINMQNL